VTGAIALGVAAGVAYTIGGSLGAGALSLVVKEPSAAAITGAAWGGRIATFLILGRLLGGS